mmetsp:Transcript_4108/g.16564  ORF Transcript_4108/g.16564 Transcript_4108/m.16564 type:complete len:104 (+) Transcript_4108:212-523(+)
MSFSARAAATPPAAADDAFDVAPVHLADRPSGGAIIDGVRRATRWMRLKYYHYTLWTGVYMMDRHETVVINVIVCLALGYFVRWLVGGLAWALGSMFLGAAPR